MVFRVFNKLCLIQWLLEVQRIQVQQHINQLEDVKHETAFPSALAYPELYHFLCKHCKRGLIKPPLLKSICWANQPLPNE